MDRFGNAKRSIGFGKLAGVTVLADRRLFIVLLILAAITAFGLRKLNDDLLVSAILGIFTAVAFFVCVFIHEMAHAVVARRNGIEVLDIILHPFGGLTRFRREPETPLVEFRIAVAGPAASFVLGMLFTVAGVSAIAGGLDILAAIFFVLAMVNFLLALFNMLPGYPLDGGRVLRAYLRHNGRTQDQATIITGRSGQAIAVVLVVFGVVIVLLRADLLTGSWAALTGVFLFDSARRVMKEAAAAEDVTAAAVMKLAVPIDPAMPLQRLFDEILPAHRQAVFPVAKGRELFGMLLLADIKLQFTNEMRSRTVAEAMRPIVPEHFVEMEMPLVEVKQLMRTNGCMAVAVVDANGKLAGFIGG